MGYQSGEIRQHLHHFITFIGLTCAISLNACLPANVKVKVDPVDGRYAQRQLAEYRANLAGGFFETVIQQSKRVLHEDEMKPPADIALYALGEVYAHHAYDGKNYILSKYYFDRLLTTFPDSPLAWEARTFVSFYNAFFDQEKALAVLRKKQSQESSRKVVQGKQNFPEAILQNQQIISKSPARPPADAALYNLGLIYAHVDNPGKDLQKARGFFRQLTKKFPLSPLVEEARIWLGIFQTIDKMQEIDREIEQQKKQLNR